MSQEEWGTIPERRDVAAFKVNNPNPMGTDDYFSACVESLDDSPIKVLDVTTLTIKRLQ